VNLLAPVRCVTCNHVALLDRWQVQEALDRGWSFCAECQIFHQWVVPKERVFYLPDGDLEEFPVYMENDGRLTRHSWLPRVP
jgi:hypothetical protein